MALGFSKRQQARNERALQELITTVPGNNVCADCQARNPGWASWNLGVFLCMRCAGLHRKLGTHISKVKSLSMDSWSSDHVDNMKRIGNVASNKIYNPKNIKPPIPIDADEVDAAMERFIRQKYEQRSLADGKPRPPSRNNTGGRSSEDSPPPLPPKTGKRFGFTLRAHSAQYPVKPAMLSPPPVRVDVNSPSRVYTATTTDESYDGKLATLREMGFPDDKRNSTVLKGLSGDLERTIESLVRLGEGSRPSSRNPTPSVTPRSGNFPAEAKNSPSPPKPVSKTTNPFDMPTRAATQPESIGISFGQPELPPSQQQRPIQATQMKTGSISYNPFDVPGQAPAQAPLLGQAFQSMQISQPLFPNSTGGYPSQQQQLQQARYQQSMTPPVPFLPQQYSYVSTPPPIGNSNPFFQTPPPQTTSMNPFFAQPPVPQSNPFLSQMPSLNAHVQPQAQFQSQAQSPVHQQNSQFQPQTQFQPSQPQQPHAPPQPQHQYSAPLPFPQSNVPQGQQFFQPQQSFQQQPQQFQPQPQPQPLLPQQTGRIDKTSIMALYNYPQLAPAPAPFQAPISPNQNVASPSTITPAPPQRSVTMPVTLPTSNASPSSAPTGFPVGGSRNPFIKAGAGKFDTIMEQPEIPRHTSRESVQVQNLDSGRHSPDAFASLSARYVR